MAKDPKDKKKEKKKENPTFEGDLEGAMKHLKKLFGDDVVYSGEIRIKPCKVIQTGSLALDVALGVGGLPRGRITEIFGPEGSGKTTLALHVIAEAQKAGGRAAFIDVEHALDPVYAKAIGVDLEKILFSQPNSGEEALSVAEILCATKVVDVVVVDSVAALIPKAMLLGNIGDSTSAASVAQLMSKSLPRIIPKINKSDTLVIFINQIREKIGVMFGSPETTPGGRALKFFATVRIRVSKGASMTDVTEGTDTRAKVIKNKVASPFEIANFDIIYGKGIDNYGTILDFGVDEDIIHKSGSHYSVGDTKMGNGKEAAAEFLRENPEVSQKIENMLKEKLLPETEPEAEPEEDSNGDTKV